MIKPKASLFTLTSLVGLALLAGCGAQPTQPAADAGNSVPTVTASPKPAANPRAAAVSSPSEEIPAIRQEAAIFFARGASELTSTEKIKLEALAARLAENRNLRLTLVGHANDNGSTSYNLAVSEGRVRAVEQFLRTQRVAASQLRAQPLGSEKVPTHCRSAACRQQYRRVDLIVSEIR